MRIIGENIHILSPRVKEAVGYAVDAWNKEGLTDSEREELLTRARTFFQDSARRQVEAGAWAVDLNIGPQKKNGVRLLPWLVQTVQEAVDVPLCLDTTNLAAIEAACEVIKRQPIINSTSAEAERLDVFSSNLIQMRARIMNALERMEDGSYGTCMRCGKDIPIDRLRAIPYAEYDVACQEIIDREQAVRAGSA